MQCGFVVSIAMLLLQAELVFETFQKEPLVVNCGFDNVMTTIELRTPPGLVVIAPKASSFFSLSF